MSLTVTNSDILGASVSGVSKAWVNFNGTGTVAIRGSFNVTSITDNGTGDYTVNFTTPMPSANYSVSGMIGRGDSTGVNPGYMSLYGTNDGSNVLGTGGFRINTSGTTANPIDVCNISLQVFSA